MPTAQRLEHALRLHVDVTRRILTFMARRHGGAEGDELADAAELRSVRVLELLDELGAAADADEERWREAVRQIGVALTSYSELQDQMLDLLRRNMDDEERSELSAALATGVVTSTV